MANDSVRKVDKNGRVSWYNKDGKLHRDPKEGPAVETPIGSNGRKVVEFWENGNLIEIQHLKDGQLHNPSGPAVIRPGGEGGEGRPGGEEEYWIDGKQLTHEEFLELVKKRKELQDYQNSVNPFGREQMEAPSSFSFGQSFSFEPRSDGVSDGVTIINQFSFGQTELARPKLKYSWEEAEEARRKRNWEEYWEGEKEDEGENRRKFKMK